MTNLAGLAASLASFIWKNAEDLWEDFKYIDFGKIILPFTFLRCLECVLEPTRKAVFEAYEDFKDGGFDLDLILANLNLTDYENVPLMENIRDYFTREVLLYLPDAYCDETYCDDKDKQVGGVRFEINFNRCFCKYVTPRKLASKDIEDVDGAYPVMSFGGESAKASAFIFNGESVLLEGKGTIDKPLYINGPCRTVDTLFYTKITDNAFPKFVYYSTQTIPFGHYSTNTVLPSMTGEDLSSHLIAVPEFFEQRAITNTLNREATHIVQLTEKSQHSINLLKERSSAPITASVTGQIDLRE